MCWLACLPHAICVNDLRDPRYLSSAMKISLDPHDLNYLQKNKSYNGSVVAASHFHVVPSELILGSWQHIVSRKEVDASRTVTVGWETASWWQALCLNAGVLCHMADSSGQAYVNAEQQNQHICKCTGSALAQQICIPEGSRVQRLTPGHCSVGPAPHLQVHIYINILMADITFICLSCNLLCRWEFPALNFWIFQGLFRCLRTHEWRASGLSAAISRTNWPCKISYHLKDLK